MKTWYLSLALATAFSLSGCATTPSKPLSFAELGQFSATPLNAKTYRISFQATPNMSYGTAEEITLVKAAQATVQNGFQLFKVTDDPSNRSQQPPRKAVVYASPMYPPSGFYRRHPAFWPDPFYDMPQVVSLDPVQVSYTIECFKNNKAAPHDAFDASLILKSLGAKYGLSATGGSLAPPTATPPQPK